MIVAGNKRNRVSIVNLTSSSRAFARTMVISKRPWSLGPWVMSEQSEAGDRAD